MKAVAILLYLLHVGNGYGQGPGGPPRTLSVTPRFVMAVVGLTFNAATHQQEANFSVSVNMGSPPAGDSYSYSWSSTDNALTFDDPSAAATAAHGSGTGIYYATCSVLQVRIGSGEGGGIPSITIVHSGNGSSRCAAIGGPVRVSVGGNSAPSYDHDGNDRTKSWYLTHYGYSHALPTPLYAELTHRATMIIGDQPTIVVNGIVKGTTITWTLPGSTYTANPKTTGFNAKGSIVSQPLTVLVGAEGAFKDGVPKVHFQFDDGVISGDADDDSAQTQVPFTNRTTGVVVWEALVYKVSGHKPDTLVRAETSSANLPPPSGHTHWTLQARIKYILKDQDGAAMPGVWIQERFTGGNPLGININGYGTTNNPHSNGDIWITLLVSVKDGGSMANTDGIFNGYDFIRYWWAVGDTATKTTGHTYFAGTSDATMNATTGIPIGTYTITFVAGQPGTTTQTDPPPPTP